METIFTLYVGLNDKDTKRQKINTVEATKIIQNLVVEKFGGGTIYGATGVYQHKNGEIVIEETLRIEIIGATDEKIAETVKILKTILNQESVGVAKSTQSVNWA